MGSGPRVWATSKEVEEAVGEVAAWLLEQQQQRREGRVAGRADGVAWLLNERVWDGKEGRWRSVSVVGGVMRRKDSRNGGRLDKDGAGEVMLVT